MNNVPEIKNFLIDENLLKNITNILLELPSKTSYGALKSIDSLKIYNPELNKEKEVK